MKNNKNESKWDLFLKASVYENCMRELDQFPSIEELDSMTLPPKYEYSMRNFLKKICRKKRINDIMLVGKRIASIVIVILAVGFIFLLSSSEVRSSCLRVLMKYYERFVKVSYMEGYPEGVLHIDLQYIPEGFSVTESLFEGTNGYVQYQNSMGEQVTLYYYTEKQISYVDKEHYMISRISFGDTQGEFWEAIDTSFNNMLFWDTQNAFYVLESNLDKKEMIKMAENVE